MKIEMCEGRPLDSKGRSETEMRVYDFLDALGISYRRADHDPAMTMEVCRDIDEVLDAVICKNLFLCNRQQTSFYLLMIPENKIFKTKDLSAQISSSRLSFADSTHMLEYLGVTPGSVSVMGLMNDKNGKVRLLIDRDVLNSEHIGCHPCVNTSSLRIKTSDLIEKIIPAMRHTYTAVDL